MQHSSIPGKRSHHLAQLFLLFGAVTALCVGLAGVSASRAARIQSGQSHRFVTPQTLALAPGRACMLDAGSVINVTAVKVDSGNVPETVTVFVTAPLVQRPVSPLSCPSGRAATLPQLAYERLLVADEIDAHAASRDDSGKRSDGPGFWTGVGVGYFLGI